MQDSRADRIEREASGNVERLRQLTRSGQTRRRVLAGMGGVAGTFLAGCSSNSDGGSEPTGSPDDDTSSPTDTPTDTAAGTPTQTPGEVRQAINNARTVYGEELGRLAETQVVVAVDGKLELAIVTEQGWDLYRETDVEAAKTRVEKTRKEVDGLIDSAEDEASKEALEVLNILGLYIQTRFDQYGQIVRAYPNASRAFNAFYEFQPRQGVEPARTAVSALTQVSKQRQGLVDALDTIENEYSYSPSFDNWNLDGERQIQSFIQNIVYEYTPAFKGVKGLVEGTTVEIEAQTAFDGENYSDALTFSKNALSRHESTIAAFQKALDRGIRYNGDAYEFLECGANDRRSDTEILVEAAEQAENGNTSDAESTFEEYLSATEETPCRESSETATPSTTNN